MVQQSQVDEYDVVLLGSGLGSLVAGTLLARRRRSVLLLKERGYESSFTRDGYRFQVFSNFSQNIVRSPSSRKLLQALSVQLLTSPESQKHSFQVLLPEARVDLFCSPAERQVEWNREFPKEASRVGCLWTELETVFDRLKREENQKKSRSFFPLRRRSFLPRFLFPDSPLDLSPFSHEFKMFVKLQLLGWGSLVPDRCAASLTAYLLSCEDSNAWSSPLDPETLTDSLLTQYLRAGGRVEEIDGVEKGNQSSTKGFEIQLAGGGRMIRSRFLVLNAPLHRAISLEGRGGKRLSTWSRRIRPKYVVYPIFIGVQEKVIPVGMGDLLISLRDVDKPLEGGNLLFLIVNRKEDPTGLPDGKRAITVGSLIPWERYFETTDHAGTDQHRAGVLNHLHGLFPFLEHYVAFIDSDRGNEMVRHWSYPYFFWESLVRYRWREGLVPTKIAGNLYCAGSENFPFLGFEGEVLGGWMVAQQIARKYS